jgi:integrase
VKAKITNQLLASLAAGATPYEVNDTELRGFQVRVQPSGTKTFLCVYRLRDSGRKNRYVIGRTPPLTPNQARDEAKKILGDVARGIDPNEARRQQRLEERKPTLLQFLDEHYSPWAETNLGTAEQTLARIRAAFQEFLGKRLDSLTAWQLDKWKSERLRSGLKPTTVNRELAALRSALTKAVEWEFVAEHPLRKVKQAKVDEDHRVRFLSEAEEAGLRSALEARDTAAFDARARHSAWRIERGHAPVPLFQKDEFADHIRPMILISINTGLRRGELFKLKRSDINLPSRMLKVRAAAAKSGKSRFVPLNEEAADVFERWMRQHPADDDELVFPGKDGSPLTNVASAWGSVCAAAKLKDFRWHDLRHHFASRLVMAGVDLNTVRELMGHADLKMTLRYAHLAPEHKAQAVAKLMRVA